MRPVLFAANATTFTSNGLGRLDPTKCVVVEERNGLYELQCVVPVNSVHFDDIANNMILAVVPGDGMSVQAFRIYQITEPMNGLVGIAARHISYDLSYNTVMPFTASSCSAALTGLASHVVETNMFTMWTDKSTLGTFAVKQPETFRGCLGGKKGSILDVYGGEYEWDNWTVKLKNQRGSDTNVTLRYGKNITDITQEQNLESVVTGIVPFWVQDETVVTLPEKSVDSGYASQYPYKRTVPVDFSNEWQDAPTAAQLRAKAQSYILANNIGLPKVSIQVSFVALWQTEEYKDIAPLERVKLCDTVGVNFEQYGISTRAKVVRTEWDCLTERYLSIELGETKSNFASTLAQTQSETSQEIVEAKSDLQKAIDNATSIITGTKGGYLKLNFNADNEPYELLIMDTDSIDTATNVWRWNLGGLGHSSTGYEGTYGTAITQDGKIVADFITTGALNASLITTGMLEDVNHNMQINPATGEIIAKKIAITSTNFTLDVDGNMVATSATLNNVTLNSVKDNAKVEIKNGILEFFYGNTSAGRIHSQNSDGYTFLDLEADEVYCDKNLTVLEEFLCFGLRDRGAFKSEGSFLAREEGNSDVVSKIELDNGDVLIRSGNYSSVLKIQKLSNNNRVVDEIHYKNKYISLKVYADTDAHTTLAEIIMNENRIDINGNVYINGVQQ